MIPKDDDSVESASSFGRMFARGVPKYDKERMLMPSPVPPPKAVIKKPIQEIKMGNSDDESDDGDKQQERENEKISRLVKMAKAQQNLMTAWFAASSGAAGEQCFPPMPPKQRRSQRRDPAASTMVDLDKDDEVSSQTSGARSTASRGSNVSSTVSRERRFGFLGSIIPVTSNGPSARGNASVFSGDTPKMSNTSPQSRFDPELGSIAEESSMAAKPLFTRNRTILVILVLIFLIALISLGILVIQWNGQKEQPPAQTSKELWETVSPAPVLPIFKREPSSVPSTVPSQSPTTTSPTFVPTATTAPSSKPSTVPSVFPSDQPSFHPTAAPSGSPSVNPTGMPTLTPSDIPSLYPSRSPTASHAPTTLPSAAPSSVFSTSILELQGSAIWGAQSGEQFGYGVSLNRDGTVLAVGARYFENNGLRRAGRVQVLAFDSSTNDWVFRGQPLYGRHEVDQFGFSVSLSGDGSRMAVSEPGLDGGGGNVYRAGGVRVFDWEPDLQIWNPVGQELQGEGRASLFGVNVKLSGDGSRLAVGSPYFSNVLNLGGRVRVYEFHEESNNWDEFGDPLDGTHSSDWFGWAIDFDDEGTHLVVGAPRNAEYGGYVRSFRFTSSESDEESKGIWIQTGPDITSTYENSESDDQFGMAVALHGDYVAVGAPWTDANGQPNSGYAAVFVLNDDQSEWVVVGEPLMGSEFNEQRGLAIALKGDDEGTFLATGSPGSVGGAGMMSFHKLTDSGDWDSINYAPRGDNAKDEFGSFIEMSIDGSIVAVGIPENVSSGRVNVFKQSSS